MRACSSAPAGHILDAMKKFGSPPEPHSPQAAACCDGRPPRRCNGAPGGLVAPLPRPRLTSGTRGTAVPFSAFRFSVSPFALSLSLFFVSLSLSLTFVRSLGTKRTNNDQRHPRNRATGPPRTPRKRSKQTLCAQIPLSSAPALAESQRSVRVLRRAFEICFRSHCRLQCLGRFRRHVNGSSTDRPVDLLT